MLFSDGITKARMHMDPQQQEPQLLGLAQVDQMMNDPYGVAGELEQPMEVEQAIGFHEISRGVSRLGLALSITVAATHIARLLPSSYSAAPYAIFATASSGVCVWKIRQEDGQQYWQFLLFFLLGLVGGWWDFFWGLTYTNTGQSNLIKTAILLAVFLTTIVVYSLINSATRNE